MASKWDWESTQDRKDAYDAILNKGLTTKFKSSVWNEIVDLIKAGYIEWIGENSPTIDSAYMTDSDKAMTANRFNTASSNVIVKESEWPWEKSLGRDIVTGDVCYGSYFIALTDGVNYWLAKTPIPFKIEDTFLFDAKSTVGNIKLDSIKIDDLYSLSSSAILTPRDSVHAIVSMDITDSISVNIINANSDHIIIVGVINSELLTNAVSDISVPLKFSDSYSFGSSVGMMTGIPIEFSFADNFYSTISLAISESLSTNMAVSIPCSLSDAINITSLFADNLIIKDFYSTTLSMEARLCNSVNASSNKQSVSIKSSNPDLYSSRVRILYPNTVINSIIVEGSSIAGYAGAHTADKQIISISSSASSAHGIAKICKPDIQALYIKNIDSTANTGLASVLAKSSGDFKINTTSQAASGKTSAINADSSILNIDSAAQTSNVRAQQIGSAETSVGITGSSSIDINEAEVIKTGIQAVKTKSTSDVGSVLPSNVGATYNRKFISFASKLSIASLLKISDSYSLFDVVTVSDEYTPSTWIDPVQDGDIVSVYQVHYIWNNTTKERINVDWRWWNYPESFGSVEFKNETDKLVYADYTEADTKIISISPDNLIAITEWHYPYRVSKKVLEIYQLYGDFADTDAWSIIYKDEVQAFQNYEMIEKASKNRANYDWTTNFVYDEADGVISFVPNVEKLVYAQYAETDAGIVDINAETETVLDDWSYPYKNGKKVCTVFQANYLGNSEDELNIDCDFTYHEAEKTISFDTSAEADSEYQSHTLSEIQIATMPDKVKYSVGKVFDPTGMEVKAIWSDGFEKMIAGYTYSKEPLTLDDTKVTISFSYKGDTKTADVPITVVSEYYEVENISTTYGFALNANDYYESNNKGVDSSYALCKVTFLSSSGNLILDCIDYAESGYDFGIISNVDQTLSSSNSYDSTYFYSFCGKSSTSVQTVTVPVAEGEEHFITIKYRKDGSASTGNDSFQFKVRFE